MATVIARDVLRLLNHAEPIFLPMATLSYDKDHKEIATGQVEIHKTEEGKYAYRLTSSQFDLSATNKAKKHLKSNTYSPIGWPRIDGKDAFGREWTITRLDPTYDFGETDALIASGQSSIISANVQTDKEDVARIEIVLSLKNFEAVASEVAFFVGVGKQLTFSGTTIWFEYNYDVDELHVSALYTDKCPQPYLDTWVYEPLQILFGIPIEPAVAVRIPHDCNWNTQIHCWGGQTVGGDVSTGLWAFGTAHNREQFWQWYSALFEYVSSYQEDENLLFYGNPLSYYYRELHFASQRTIWLRNMAYAATIEAFADLLIPEKKRKLKSTEADSIAAIKRYLSDFNREGMSAEQRMTDCRKIESLHNALAYIQNWSARGKLLELVNQGVLDRKHEKSWSLIRNPTMHGELGDTWSTAEGDEHTRNLMEAVARMTCAVIVTGFQDPFEEDTKRPANS